MADLDANVTERLEMAEKDRRFAEGMRLLIAARTDSIDGLVDGIDELHISIYGRPCTAGKEEK